MEKISNESFQKGYEMGYAMAIAELQEWSDAVVLEHEAEKSEKQIREEIMAQMAEEGRLGGFDD